MLDRRQVIYTYYLCPHNNNNVVVLYTFVAFFPIDVTIKEGARDSTYRAFLKPALKRKNLRVVRYAIVDKVLKKLFQVESIQ
jgi:choline dehydrogenase-like flavoprotein